ncbi:hypothetical protein M2360_001449 [Rhizobium sp. SG_E_25_P2]|uniref:hypothetical protein n=1 Tax=Rhizobium sp. SG_E_25_P2 TaxID=2879942 RepID=UPI0024757C29|nr:hypothetical protein [Rhizobium sp. SG_E_25_P2]MDH6266053.1 hypothetical protein [Rhizobium sp. SG_E_25_P2]
MSISHWAAAAVVSFVGTDVLGADVANGGFQPPASTVTLSNLGKAGLLRSYFESDQFGSVQWRVGQSRVTIGAAESSGLPNSHYKDGTADTVVPLNFMFGLPDGQSAVRLGVRGTVSNGANYPVELDGGTGRVDLQYLRFPDANTMWALGGFIEYTDLDIEASGSVERRAGGLRADFLNEFSEHWGVAARAEYSWGESDLKIDVGPGLVMEHKQGDDHFYTQAELIGQYRSQDFSIIPENWVFHPVLGIEFQRSFIESTANSFGEVSSGVVGATEDYGAVWAHMRMEKEVPPGGWSPNFLLGIEQEFVNDLNAVVDEPTYAVFGAGISQTFGRSHRMEVSYTRHQGLEERRWNQAIVGTLTMNF